MIVGNVIEYPVAKLHEQRQAMYTAYCLIAALDSHLQYTLPRDGKVTKQVEQQAMVLRSQAQRVLAQIQIALPYSWFTESVLTIEEVLQENDAAKKV